MRRCKKCGELVEDSVKEHGKLLIHLGESVTQVPCTGELEKVTVDEYQSKKSKHIEVT